MEKTPEEIVGSIDDLLTEILLRLPVKSLIRFKLVSKHWQSLISDPGFAIRHNPFPKPVGMFFPRWSKDYAVYPYAYIDFSNEKPTIRLSKELARLHTINSCNGLLLCATIPNNYKNYIVYNPTTNKSLTIPYDGIRSEMLGVSLVFDPAKSRHYKVVRVRVVRDLNESSECKFEVYSSENGCWRKPNTSFMRQGNFNDGVYWNGAIHWINRETWECLYFNPDDDDDRTMKPRMAPSIPSASVKNNLFYFGESCGRLNFVEFFEPGVSSKVYELRRDYSEWFVKYSFDLSTIYEGLDFIKNYDKNKWYITFYSIMLIRGEKDEDSFMLLNYLGKFFMRYNFVEETCERICDVEEYEKINIMRL